MLRWISAIYSLVLNLYPPAFRQELGAEMQAVFTQLVVDAELHGRVRFLSVCWRELRDLPGSLIEAHHQHSKGGTLMKTPDYSRWFGDPALPPDQSEPSPWRQVWLGAAFFILLLTAFTSYGWSPYLPFEISTAIKIGNVFTMVSMFIFLGMAILGGVKKFPDWSLPYVGFVIAMLCVIVLILTNPNQVEIWMGVVFFFSPVAVIILARWIKPISSLWQAIWEDPTRLGWLYTGVISLALLIVLDDQNGEYLYKTITFLWFIPAAILYLRSRRVWVRMLVPALFFLLTWMEAIPFTYGIFDQPFYVSWRQGVGTMVRVGLLILLWLFVPALWILLRRVKWITPAEV